MLNSKIFKEHFLKKDTKNLEILLKQYQWEVDKCLAMHDMKIEIIKEILEERNND